VGGVQKRVRRLILQVMADQSPPRTIKRITEVLRREDGAPARDVDDAATVEMITVLSDGTTQRRLYHRS